MTTYEDSGVSIEAGNDFVQKIKDKVKTTHVPGVVGGLGGFGALFDLSLAGFDHPPMLVAATDGVGSKVQLAQKYDHEHTVGIDLVAMCVNDILCHGAQPLFFLDYYATGQLDVDRGRRIIDGIVDGCLQAECALVGGETAEMPTVYGKSDYDLAGFCVGAVEQSRLFPRLIAEDNIIVGLPSHGIHSNGFSMLTRDLPHDVVEDVLHPTRIYVKLLKEFLPYLNGMVHITGGGVTENIPRIIPDGLCAEINLNHWSIPHLFNRIRLGQLTFDGHEVSEEEMLRVFNCGIGLVLILERSNLEYVLSKLTYLREKFIVLGKIVKGSEKIAFHGNLTWESSI
jgi:phosphoribosylformylglycinamidine cyclo-ligase